MAPKRSEPRCRRGAENELPHWGRLTDGPRPQTQTLRADPTCPPPRDPAISERLKLASTVKNLLAHVCPVPKWSRHYVYACVAALTWQEWGRASNTGGLRQRVLLLGCLQKRTHHTEHYTRGFLDLKEVAVKSSEKPKRGEPHCPNGDPWSLKAAAASAWLQHGAGKIVGPEGNTWFALCPALPILATAPHLAMMGLQRLQQPGPPGYSEFSEATLLASGFFLQASGLQRASDRHLGPG